MAGTNIRIKFGLDQGSVGSVNKELASTLATACKEGVTEGLKGAFNATDFSAAANKFASSLEKAMGNLKLDKFVDFGDSFNRTTGNIADMHKQLVAIRGDLAYLREAFNIDGADSAISQITGKLRELNKVVSELNNKDFNIQNVFTYKGGTSSDGLDVYREKALALIDLLNKLQQAVPSNMPGKSFNLFAKLTEGDMNLKEMFKSANSAKTVATLQTLISQAERFRAVFNEIFAGIDGFDPEKMLPDTSAYEAATKRVEEFEAANKRMEKTFEEAASNIVGNKETKDVLSAEGAKEQLGVIGTTLKDINGLFDTLRTQIISTFDFTKPIAGIASLRDEVSKLAEGLDIVNTKYERMQSVRFDADTKAAMASEKELLKSIKNQVSSAYNSFVKGSNVDFGSDGVRELETRYSALITMINEANAAHKTSGQVGYETMEQFQVEANAIRMLITALSASASAHNANASAAREDADSASILEKRISNLQKSIVQQLNKDATLKGSDFGKDLQEIISRLDGGDIDISKLREIEAEVAKIRSEYARAQETSGGFFSTLTGSIRAIAGFEAFRRVVTKVISVVKKMVSAIKEVDAAMTELKKVTDLTSSGYNKFYQQAVSASQKIGATVSDTINATADFARLGYETDDALQLAQAALIYKNVGDGIDDVSQATESLISTIKAFGIEASNAMIIVDEFNEIGNRFAISSTGIGEALVRSASALEGAGNSLEESIGLVTAANAIIQNPESVGTALKTLTMYLRAAKPDLEAMGEDAEDCANSVAELREKLIALTGVDIMLNENEFKSTYQIIQEISKVWDKMADVDRAAVTKLIGGKRNANIIQALMTNFSDAESVVEAATNAAGSAAKENEEYLNSIAGKLDLLKGKFQELAENVLSSDLVKFVLDIANALMTVATTLTKLPVLNTFVIAFAGISEVAGILTKLPNLIKNVASALSLVSGAAGGVAGATGGISAFIGSTPFAAAVAGGAALISMIVQIVKYHKQQKEEAIAAAYESAKAQAESNKTYAESVSRLDDLRGRFKTLSQGVDENGRNVSLTTSEYQEYKSILDEIVSISPSIVERYNEQGEAILDYKNAIDKATDSLTELNNKENERYLAGRRDAWGKLLEDRQNASVTLSNDTAESFEIIMAAAIDDLSISEQTDEALNEIGEKIAQAYVNAGILSAERAEEMIRVATTDIINGERTGRFMAQNLNGFFTTEESAAMIEKAEQLQTMLEGLGFGDGLLFGSADAIKALSIAIDDLIQHAPDIKDWNKALDTMSNDLALYATTLNEYKDIADNPTVTGALWDYIRELTKATDGFGGDWDAGKSAINNVVDELSDAMNSNELVRSLSDAQKAYERGKISLEEYSAAVESFRNLGPWFIGLEGDNAEQVFDILLSSFESTIEVSSETAESIDGVTKSLVGFADAAKQLEDGYDILKKAQSELARDGKVSVDTIKSINEALTEGESLSDYLYKENDVIKLNEEAWRNRSKAAIESDLELKRAALSNAESELSQLLFDMSWGEKTEFGVTQDQRDRAESLKQLIDELRISIAAYNAEIDDINAKNDPMNLSTLVDGIVDVKDEASELAQALDKIRNGETLDYGERLGLYEKFGDILPDSFLDADDATTQLLTVEKAMDSFQQQYDKLVQDRIDSLERMRAMAVAFGESTFAIDAALNIVKGMQGRSFIDMLIGQDDEIDKLSQLTDGLDKIDEYIGILKSGADGLDLSEIHKLVELLGDDWKRAINEDGSLNNDFIIGLINSEIEATEGAGDMRSAIMEAIDAATTEEEPKAIDKITEAMSKVQGFESLLSIEDNELGFEDIQKAFDLLGDQADRFLKKDDMGNYIGVKKDQLHDFLRSIMVTAGATEGQLSAFENWFDSVANGAEEARSALEQLSDTMSSISKGQALLKSNAEGASVLDMLDSIVSFAKDNKISIADLIDFDSLTLKTDGVEKAMRDLYSVDKLKGMLADLNLSDEQIMSIKVKIDGAIEAEADLNALSNAISKVSTASNLLSSIRSGNGDFFSMFQTAMEMAQQSGQAIDEFFTVVNGDAAWNEAAIEAWADAWIDGLEGIDGVAHETIDYMKQLMKAQLDTATAAERASAALSKSQTAVSGFSKLGPNNGVSYDEFKSLIDISTEYAKAIEYNNGQMTLNRDKYNQVTASVLKQNLAEAKRLKGAILMSKEYQDLQQNVGRLNDTEQQRLNDLNAEIMSYEILANEIERASDAFAKFNSADTSVNASSYDSAAAAWKVIDDTRNNRSSELYGMVGREQYKDAVALLIRPEVDTKEAEKTLKRYFTDAKKGAANFVNDLKKNGFVDEATGAINTTTEEISKALGISEDAVRALFAQVNQGLEVPIKLTVRREQSDVDDLTKKLETAQQTLDDIDAGKIDINTTEGQAKLLALDNQIAEITTELGDMRETQPDLDTDLAVAKLTVVQSRLNGFSKDIEGLKESGMDVDTANAMSKIDDLKSGAKDVVAAVTDVVKHKMSINAAPAKSAIGTISKALGDLITTLNNLNGKTFSYTLTEKRKSLAAGTVNSSSSSSSNTYRTNGVNPGLAINGTGIQYGKSAAPGWIGAPGGRTLVGEVGEEIIVDPYENVWYTVGSRGPEFVNVPKGAIVFNAEQTKKLLSYGRASTTGKAMLSGTAAATYGVSGSLAGYDTSAADSIISSGTGKKKLSNSQILKTYQEALEYLDHLIEHQEYLYDMFEHDLNYTGMTSSLEAMVKIYQDEIAKAEKGVAALIKNGAKDTDKELQEMERALWEANRNLISTLDKINTVRVDALNDQIDGLQGAYEKLQSAAEEFSEHGSISMDTYQDLLSNGIEFLAFLDEVGGKYVVNTQAVKDFVAAQKEQLTVESAQSYLKSIETAVNNGAWDKVIQLMNGGNVVSQNSWDSIMNTWETLKQTIHDAGIQAGFTEDQINNSIAAFSSNLSKLPGLASKVVLEVGDSADSTKQSYEDADDYLKHMLAHAEQTYTYMEHEGNYSGILSALQDQEKIEAERLTNIQNYVANMRKELQDQGLSDEAIESNKELQEAEELSWSIVNNINGIKDKKIEIQIKGVTDPSEQTVETIEFYRKQFQMWFDENRELVGNAENDAIAEEGLKKWREALVLQANAKQSAIDGLVAQGYTTEDNAELRQAVTDWIELNQQIREVDQTAKDFGIEEITKPLDDAAARYDYYLKQYEMAYEANKEADAYDGMEFSLDAQLDVYTRKLADAYEKLDKLAAKGLTDQDEELRNAQLATLELEKSINEVIDKQDQLKIDRIVEPIEKTNKQLDYYLEQYERMYDINKKADDYSNMEAALVESIHILEAQRANAVKEVNDLIEQGLTEEDEALQKAYKNVRSIEDSVRDVGEKIEDLNIDRIVEPFNERNRQFSDYITYLEQMYTEAERGLDYRAMGASLAEQARTYSYQAEAAGKAMNDLIASGVDRMSEEVQSMQQAFWAANNNLASTMEKISALYVDALNSKIDDLQAGLKTLTSAADEYAKTGKLSMDTYQEILSHGVEYLAYLDKVDGQYVVNRESIEKMVAAQKEQLAIETALAYISNINQAADAGEANRLNQLVNATEQISENSWDAVEAQLLMLGTSGKLTVEQLETVNQNVRKLRDMSKEVVLEVDDISDALNDQAEAVDKIVDLTEDLIRQEVEDQVDALNEQIDQYKKIIDLKKESLQKTKEEDSYQKDVASKLKDITDLQARIDKLALDDSRTAQAERMRLIEELNERQEDLADYQTDHSYDAQVEALDKMAESYEEEKQGEIEALQKTISSEEKVYQLAIERIRNNWDTLYQDLLDWNTEQGSILNSEITDNWDMAYEAAKKYGDYVSSMSGLLGEIERMGGTNETLRYRAEDISELDGVKVEDEADELIVDAIEEAISFDAAGDDLIVEAMEESISFEAAGVAATEETNRALAEMQKQIDDSAKVAAQAEDAEAARDGLALTQAQQAATDGVAAIEGVRAAVENDAWINYSDMQTRNPLIEGIQNVVYRVVDIQQFIAAKLGALVDDVTNVITPSYATGGVYASVGVGAMSGVPVSQSQSVDFRPNISVSINGAGNMSSADAQRYGSIVANTAIDKLYTALEKKGVTTIYGGTLKTT